MPAGVFANGSGALSLTISGTPSASGNASFALSIGGQICSFTVVVQPNLAAQYPANSVFCSAGPTAIVDVTNPITGKIWMDRNLGATQIATSMTDANAYGDLYQWGRRADGHQCRTNFTTTTTLSSTDQPVHGNFILGLNLGYDWRSPANSNLWQGVNGINNPCPNGYRLPTESELDNEHLSWSTNNSLGAFASPLKLQPAGYRGYNSNVLFGEETILVYWSSSIDNLYSRAIYGNSSDALMTTGARASAYSVRCIKN